MGADRCGLGGWRNGLRFDPFKKYGDWSYVDIMLDPLVNALRSAMTADTKVCAVLCSSSCAYMMPSWRWQAGCREEGFGSDATSIAAALHKDHELVA